MLLIVQDVARALVHLHSQRIVHRDLKEDNVLVFLAADGTYLCCKLADVGLAKVRCGGAGDCACPRQPSPRTAPASCCL